MPEQTIPSIVPIAPAALHDKVLEIALALPGTRFLDTPTGYGALTSKLLEAGKEVVAGDIDIAKCKLGGATKGLTLMRLDLNEPVLPLPEASFDVAVSIEGIEHLQSQWCFVRSIHRALRPGGYFIVTTPNILNIRSRLRFLMEGRYEHFKRPLSPERSWSRDLENYHIAPVSYFELQFILESCGFSIQQVATNTYKARSIATRMLKPLFRAFYRNKNNRDRKRDRGDHRALYDLIMSDAVFFGECLIVVARKSRP
ncbi:MAG: class I SAM-dependent methyltransferase [Nitrospiraceae bacterium]|nr:class I SAM-dependent methyltransferase [Nitrospiraceae bacterium]